MSGAVALLLVPETQEGQAVDPLGHRLGWEVPLSTPGFCAQTALLRVWNAAVCPVINSETTWGLNLECRCEWAFALFFAYNYNTLV